MHLEILSGNNCGHNPSSPRWYSPNRRSERPDIIRAASSNVKNFYHKPEKWLCSTWNIRTSSRQQRSEARERNGAVIQVLLDYVELASMRVGMPCKDGSFLSSSLKFIAEKAGFRKPNDKPEKGIKRTWRAINELARAGYLSINRRFKQLQDNQGNFSYQGFAAIKTIHPKLFTELGVSKAKLAIRRQQASRRLRKKNWRQKHEKFVFRQLPKSATKPIRQNKGSIKPVKYKNAQREIEQERMRIERLITLRQQYPDISLKDLADKLNNINNTPPR